MPGWLKYDSLLATVLSSGPPHELLMTVAPREAAAICERYRPLPESSSAWTTRILHFGQAALAMSTSSAVSPVQSSPAGGLLGSGDVWPIWFTILRQPFATVQGGSPYCERYTARTHTKNKKPYASTIAIVAPGSTEVSR